MFPQMSGFGIDASTARKATEANTQAHGRQLCTPSVFASEASRTTRWEACSPIEPDQRGWIDVRHALIAASERPGLTLKGPGLRRAHKGIATTVDHIWIARNRGKFIPITRVDWTQAVLMGDPAMTPDSKTKKGTNNAQEVARCSRDGCKRVRFCARTCRSRPHVHHAVHVGVGCSGDNFAKAEGGVETMADVPAKFMAEREIAQAQDAMLSGQDGWMRHASWPGVAR